MAKHVDLVGKKYGRWTVIEYLGGQKWLCKCECGNTSAVKTGHLNMGASKSCGCLGVERRRQAVVTHGYSQTNLYKVWNSMKQRCGNKNNSGYKDYGGRGISVCKEWADDAKVFCDWAIKNGYKQGLSIDRINNDGNYEPANCRWTTRKVQVNNQRLHAGISGTRGV